VEHKAVCAHLGDLVKVAYQCKEAESHLTWASEIDAKKQFTGVRYGVNPHEIRDLSKSRFHISGADLDVWEFMAEHEIDPNKYDKFMKLEPWYPIQEYRKFLPWANILSCDPERVSRTEVDEELDSLRAEISQIPLLRRELELLRRDIEKTK